MLALSFQKATHTDAPALNALVNGAYRGEGSKKGWTTEADILGGIRINEQGLRDMMSKPGALIFLATTADGQLAGCVYLEKQDQKCYLGMLTVDPLLQAGGIGKQLMAQAEQYALSQGCRAMVMTVISVRLELIAWYERHGYVKTGETKPFPIDPAFGIPKQKLEFIVLEKPLQH